MTHPLFKLLVGSLEDVEEIVYVGPWVMFAFMPALGALLQGLVIAFLILLDEALDAYIPPHFITQVIALEQKKKAGNSTVAIPEGMDA